MFLIYPQVLFKAQDSVQSNFLYKRLFYVARHLLNSIKAEFVYTYQNDKGSYDKILQKVFWTDIRGS